MPGPPRTPTQIRRAKGNPGKRAYNKREPKLPLAAPAVPDGLDTVATAEWKRLVGLGLAAQVLTRADGSILELAARAYSDWREAAESVRQNGLTYESTTEDGATLIKANPAAAIRADAWRRYRAAVCELGFTPAARAKVSTIEPSENEDPGASFFN